MLGGQRSVIVMLGLVVAAVVLSVLHNTGIGVPLEGLFQQVTAPVRGAFSAAASGVSGTLTDFQRFGEIRAENVLLRDEVIEMRASLARLRNAERENVVLREALDYSENHAEFDVVTARVVGRDSLEVLDLIVIDRGASAGIRVGMAVVSNGGLAGRVTSVKDSSAEVRPVYSQTSSVNVATQGADAGDDAGADGIVDGDGDGGLVMRRIKADDAVQVGDYLVTSGLGGGFPRGIPVGRIRSLERSPSDVFRSAVVEPLVQPERIDVVQVILGQQTGA